MKCFEFNPTEMYEAVELFAHTKAGEVFIQRESTPGAILIGATSDSAINVSEYNGLDIVTSVYVSDCNGLEAKLHQLFANVRIDPNFDYFELSESEAIDALMAEAISFV